jgi:hypothetical protein
MRNFHPHRSCTSTTLSLFDWLKLEDISISLFFVTVSRRNKMRHRLGERQPRYMKFFQVQDPVLEAELPSRGHPLLMKFF